MLQRKIFEQKQKLLLLIEEYNELGNEKNCLELDVVLNK